MKKSVIFLLIGLVGLSQATILHSIAIFSVQPDLLFILVIAFCFFIDLKWALVIALAAGFTKDIFSIGSFGVYTLIFPSAVFFTAALTKNIWIENYWLRGGLVFCLVILCDLFLRISGLGLQNLMPLGIFLRVAIMEAFYSFLAAAIIFRALK